MNRFFSIACLIVLAIITVNCKSDDNNGGTTVVPIRPSLDVYQENIKAIEEYLDNNYMIEEGNSITFDSITSPDYKQQSTLREDSRLKHMTLTNEDYALLSYSSDPKNPYSPTKYTYLKSADTIKYKIYYLVLSEGSGHKASPLDSIYMKRRTTTLKNKVFNTTNNPAIGGYYSFPTTIAEYTGSKAAPLRTNTGDRQVMQMIKTATGVKIGDNGLPTWNEGSAGRIIAFIPSGLGLFNTNDNGLAGYQPYITDITLISNYERDHDLDGIKSKYEVKKVMELDRNGPISDSELATLGITIHDYFSFDTDGDGIPNFLDIDDDGDGVSTKDELSYKDADGTIKYYPYYDANNLKTCTNTLRFLDATCFPDRKDGEWIWYPKNTK